MESRATNFPLKSLAEKLADLLKLNPTFRFADESVLDVSPIPPTGNVYPNWIKSVDWSECVSKTFAENQCYESVVASIGTESTPGPEFLKLIEYLVSFVSPKGSMILSFGSRGRFCGEIREILYGFADFIFEGYFAEDTGKVTLATQFDEVEFVLLREIRFSFHSLSSCETKAYRRLLMGSAEEALQILRESGLKRPSSNSGVRLWNKVILDSRESLRHPDSNTKSPLSVIGLWDYRFVPFTLGDYLYFLAVLEWFRKELGVEHVSVWCLQPKQDAIRFDQNRMLEESRNTRCEQVEQLTRFIPNSDFVLYKDEAAFDAAIIGAQHEHAIVPRLESESGGMFASYIHCYRFLDAIYEKHAHLPYLSPPGDVLEVAKMRVVRLRLEKGVEKIGVIHLRNSALDDARNAPLQEWIDFLKVCEKKYPSIHFLALGEGEVEQILGESGVGENVSFSRHFTGSVLEDFALVHAGDFFIGGPSGPSIVPLLSPVPYLFYDYKVINEYPYIKPPAQFPWANSQQWVHWREHDSESLYEVFSEWIKQVL